MFAASYYLDNALTDSENTGTSWANAWTNFSSAQTLYTNDTLYISGGTTEKVYYYEDVLPYHQYNLYGGTSANAMVTVTAGADAGHTGKVIFDGQGDLRSATNTGNDVHMFGFAGGFIRFDGGPTTNFVFRNWYNTNDYIGGEANSTAQTLGAPLIVTRADDSVFTRFVATNCGVILGVTDSTNVEVSYVTGRKIRGNVAIGLTPPQPSYPDSCVAHHCDIETLNDDLGGTDGFSIGSGCTIRDCTLRSVPGDTIGFQHPDSVQVYGQQYVKLYRNTFFTPPNACWEGQPGWYGQSNMHDIVIANNLFLTWNTNYSTQRLMENGGTTPVITYSNWFFLNNTFVDFSISQMMGLAWEQSAQNPAGPPDNQPSVTNVCLYNNAVINCGNAMGHWFSLAPYVNTNFNSNGLAWAKNVVANGPNFWFEATNSIASFLATGNWSGAYHAVPDSTTNLPAFISYSPYSTNNNMRVKAVDTAARAQGTNLTALFTAIGIPATDRDGTTRPAVGAWTIGAYEFSHTGLDFKGKATVQGRITF